MLGVSVDSIFCHANWAASLGGVSFPLLSDFHPKGAVARQYGLYQENAGVTSRATVIIDAGGIIRYHQLSPPEGRVIASLAEACEEIHAAYSGPSRPVPDPRPFPAGSTLFVKDRCGASLAARNARVNLHLEDAIALRNVSRDEAARAELVRVGGKDQAPCLVVEGTPLYESDRIIARMLETVAE